LKTFKNFVLGWGIRCVMTDRESSDCVV